MMRKAVAVALVTVLLVAPHLISIAIAQDQKPNFVRIDVTNVTLLKSIPMTADMTFSNLAQSIKVDQKDNQTLDVSTTFQTPEQQGPFTIIFHNRLNNATLFYAQGELTSGGARIISAPPYDETVFRILPNESSVTVSVGSVSGNFTLAASTTSSARYLVQFTVQNSTQSVATLGSNVNVIVPIHNMPPVVNFTGQIKGSGNLTILATISGEFDFVRAVGINVKSSYTPPVTYLNLTVRRVPSIQISHIPNTQIVKVPAQLVPLTQPGETTSFTFGKPPTPNVTRVTNTSTTTTSTSNSQSSSTSTQLQSQARPLIDLQPVYAAFKNNLVAIVAIVLVLFAAVVVAKRVIG